jgi:hypothetical protein
MKKTAIAIALVIAMLIGAEAWKAWGADLGIDGVRVQEFTNGVWYTVWEHTIPDQPEPPPSPEPTNVGNRALALVDSGTLFKHKPLLDEWAAQVCSESNFTVRFQSVQRVDNFDAPTRVSSLKENYDLVQAAQPDLVICIGAVARFGYGWSSFDGHGPGCNWNGNVYSGCVDWSELTDTNNFGPVSPGRTSLYWSNVAGDGRFDSGCVRPWKWPVCWIDFVKPYTDFSVHQTNLGPPFAGTRIWPAVGRDEDTLLRNYFARNLAYRRGELVIPNRVQVVGELYKLPVRAAIEAAGLTNYAYNYDQFGRLLPVPSGKITFASFEPYLWRFYSTDATHANPCVIHLQYKSYGPDRYHPSSHHYFTERIALVSLWSWSPSVVPNWLPVGKTAYDFVSAYESEKVPQPWWSIYGDLTLPLDR